MSEKEKKSKKDKGGKSPRPSADTGVDVGDLSPQVEDEKTLAALQVLGLGEVESDSEDAPAKDKKEKKQEDYILESEKECALLLLEARWLLAQMILARENADDALLRELRSRRADEKKAKGNLSVTEIMSLLQAAMSDEDDDLVARIQELKRKLAIEIRRNHVLDRDRTKLDKRIALLIKSRDPKFVNETLKMKLKSQKKKKQLNQGEQPSDFTQDSKKLEHYQDLFYLLQTEPKYMAGVLYKIQADVMEKFLETTILTLYGENFSPREELLLLKLFQKAIQVEMNVIKNVGDFLTAESVVPKMVVTYNRRKLGLDYLKNTLSPILNKIINWNDLSLELSPVLVYQQMLSQQEIKTGQKTNLERNPSEEEALQHPEVKAILEARIKDLTEVCEMFLEGIISSLDQLPYGLRWICKQIQLSSKKTLPNCSPEDILRLTGYFVYYRFINLAIVTPDTYQLVSRDVPPAVRKNLVIVAKVLQYLFNLKSFGNNEKFMVPLNSLIAAKQDVIIEYFNQLVAVDEPEDHLEVNKYMELTQKAKPVIYISLHEMVATHRLLVDNVDNLAPDKEDPLRIVLNDMGQPPDDINDTDDREIQLTLNNRFKVDMEEESEAVRLYAETKELVIPILRAVPIVNSIVRLNLMDILESGIKYSTDSSNRQLSSQINKVLENIQRLEQEGMLSKNDNYESFVHDVALEVANRAVIREQQKREISRLQGTHDQLQSHSKYINDQIVDYTKYLNDCREHFQPRKKGKIKKKVGPFKFSYKELAKQGVIVDSEVPALSRKGTSFTISSENVGMFDVDAKIAGVSVEKMQIELDDLLDRHHNGTQRLELDHVTLDVNMTLHLLNKHFRILS